MRLITIFELATRSDQDLQVIYREVFNELARGKPDTKERRHTLASLENIQRVQRSRPFRP